MGNIYELLVEILISIYGLGFLIYGILTSLDKIRIERYTTVRILLLLIPIVSGIKRGIENVIESGDYKVFITYMVVIVSMIHNYVVYKYTFKVFNLNKEETLLCIQRVLEKMGFKYNVDNNRIDIENVGYIHIQKTRTVNYIHMQHIDDKNLLGDIKDNIKEEVYKYKLPRKSSCKGSCLYIITGFFAMTLIVFNCI